LKQLATLHDVSLWFESIVCWQTICQRWYTNDIAAHALDALAQSRITDIHIIGRRSAASAAQANFSRQELRELSTVSACRIATDDGLALNAASEVEAADKMNRNTRSNIDILKSFCLPASRSCRRDAPIRSAGLRCGHVVDHLNSGLKWRDSFGGYHRSIEDYRWYRRT
jgi:hypothetical protein